MTTVFFIICNLFQLLLIYAFVEKMLTRKYNKNITFVAWIIGFIVDETLVYFANNNSLNSFLYNIIVCMVLFFSYSDSIKNKIIVLVYMNVFTMLSECLVYF